MVRTDAHRPAEVLTKRHQRRELLADAFEFLGVLTVAVFADLEFFLIHVVARIDPDFFHPLRGFERGVGFEMDVRHHRHLAARRAHLAGDVFQVRGVNFRLRGDPHDFATGLRQTQHLRDAGRGIACVGSDHRLHADRVVAADPDISHHHLAGDPAGVLEQVRAVAQGCGRIHFCSGYKREIPPRQRLRSPAKIPRPPADRVQKSPSWPIPTPRCSGIP